MFTEDLEVFFQDQDFAVRCTLTIGAATSNPFIIFDFPYFSDVGIEDENYRCTGIEVDFLNSDHESTITLDAADLPAPIAKVAGTYRIRGKQPDGTGTIELILEAQP